MPLKELIIRNVRAFERTSIHLSPNINVFVGANNSGKSTILQCVLALQDEAAVKASDTRIGTNDVHSGITYVFHDDNPPFSMLGNNSATFKVHGRSLTTTGNAGGTVTLIRPPASIDKCYVVPFLAKRKRYEYDESISAAHGENVSGFFTHLYAKLDRVSNQYFSGFKEYERMCLSVLGFVVSTVQTDRGKKGAVYVGGTNVVTIDAMGDGVANIVGLLVDLCIADNKVFVIEEPENDIHPEALKRLLAFVAEKSDRNQFIISTHSNVVVKQLGAHDKCSLFQVEIESLGDVPKASVTTIEREPSARRAVLRSLGYELTDFDLWDGWLILEESSAERIIRDYLMPWFFGELRGHICTFAAGSVSKVEPSFDDLWRLSAFLHLHPVYKDRIWVLVDGGAEGGELMKKLQGKFKGWKENRFQTFGQHDFERYYPLVFEERATNALRMTDKKAKKEAKRVLLNEVVAWIDEDRQRAQEEFAGSAKEVIEILRGVFAELRSL